MNVDTKRRSGWRTSIASKAFVPAETPMSVLNTSQHLIRGGFGRCFLQLFGFPSYDCHLATDHLQPE